MNKKFRRTPKLIITRCNYCINKIIHLINIKMFSKIFQNKLQKIMILILSVLSLIGIILNEICNQNLPFFYFLFFLLIICLCTTYRTTLDIFAAKQEFDELAAGDLELLVLKTNYQETLSSNIIYIPMVAFSTIVTYLSYELIEISVDWVLLLYCFIGLFVVVFMCTYGAIQYFILIVFIHQIKNKANMIDNFDKVYPKKTQWLMLLSELIHKCNKRYLVVGFLLIIAFSIFSLTDRFGINISSQNDIVLLSVFWFLILFFMILGAIVCSSYSNHCLFSIQLKLIEKIENSLIKEYQLSKQEDVKNSYAIRIMLLSNLPSAKRTPKRLVINMLSAIDTIASIQATISLVNMIINNDNVLIFEQIYNIIAL